MKVALSQPKLLQLALNWAWALARAMLLKIATSLHVSPRQHADLQQARDSAAGRTADARLTGGHSAMVITTCFALSYFPAAIKLPATFSCSCKIEES